MRQIYHDAITAKTSALLFCLYGVLIQTSVRVYTITWVSAKFQSGVTCDQKKNKKKQQQKQQTIPTFAARLLYSVFIGQYAHCLQITLGNNLPYPDQYS